MQEFEKKALAEHSTSAAGNPYLFTGRRFDDETSLYYYRARYYSPEIGRFLQVDPVGYDDCVNLYQYCLNNPVVYVDPSGTWQVTLGVGIGLGARVSSGKNSGRWN